MRPDRTNYEVWLVDYLDGTLGKERERELLLFLDENPDLKQELSDLFTYRMTPRNEKFMDKNSLKKSADDLSELQFEMMCIAAAENDLAEDQRSELDEIVAGNHEKRKTAELIRRIKLKPPVAEFRYKSGLKRLTLPQKVFRYSVISISAAAAILLLVTILRNPQAIIPENHITLIPPDSIRIENITVITPVKEDTEPDLASAYLNTVTKIKEGTVPETVNNETNNLAVQGLTDTSSYIVQIENISKIDYKSQVSPGNNEYGQSLAAMNLVPVTVTPDEEREGLNVSIAKFFREKIFKSETQEKGTLKAYEIADAGINGLNRIFGWEMSLEKKTDEKGEVNSVYFNSRLLKFNAPVKKSEPLE